MPIPWLRLLDVALGLSNVAGRRSLAEQQEQLAAPGSRALGHLETRLTGVVVAALKEAFDRDSRRLELEREQMDAERQRAEQALRLERLRQVADRELARLRLVAGVAAGSWLGTLFFSARLIGSGTPVRVTLGAGWLMLLAALAASFIAQSRVSEALLSVTEASDRPDTLAPCAAGMAAPWLIVLGLALVGVSVLVS